MFFAFIDAVAQPENPLFSSVSRSLEFLFGVGRPSV